jgi:hypothetical protein
MLWRGARLAQFKFTMVQPPLNIPRITRVPDGRYKLPSPQQNSEQILTIVSPRRIPPDRAWAEPRDNNIETRHVPTRLGTRDNQSHRKRQPQAALEGRLRGGN